MASVGASLAEIAAADASTALAGTKPPQTTPTILRHGMAPLRRPARWRGHLTRTAHETHFAARTPSKRPNSLNFEASPLQDVGYWRCHYRRYGYPTPYVYYPPAYGYYVPAHAYPPAYGYAPLYPNGGYPPPDGEYGAYPPANGDEGDSPPENGY